MRYALFIIVALLVWVGVALKKKKSVLDLNEADVERIFQEWEENEDDDVDWGEQEKPSRGGGIDLEGLQSGRLEPEELIRQSKKDKPVMMFVGVKGNPSDRAYTEKTSSRWMQSLHNAHQPVQRYVVGDDRVLFLVEDGSRAWDVKNYLITQSDCTTVSFEQLSFNCATLPTKTEL